MDERSDNLLAAVLCHAGACGLAWLDLTGGRFCLAASRRCHRAGG